MKKLFAILSLSVSLFAADTISVKNLSGNFDKNFEKGVSYPNVIKASSTDTVWAVACGTKTVLSNGSYMASPRYIAFCMTVDSNRNWNKVLDSFTIPSTAKTALANGDTTWGVAFCVYADTVYSGVKCYRKSAGVTVLDSTKVFRGSVQLGAWGKTTGYIDSNAFNNYRMVGTKDGLFITTGGRSIFFFSKAGMINTNHSTYAIFSDGNSLYFHADSSIYRYVSPTSKIKVASMQYRINGGTSLKIIPTKFGIDFKDSSVYFSNLNDSNSFYVNRKGVAHKIANGFKFDSSAQFSWIDNNLFYRNGGKVVKLSSDKFITYDVSTGFQASADTNNYNAYVFNSDSIFTQLYLATMHPYAVPVIDSIANATVNEKALFVQPISAKGEYGLTFSAISLPAWLVLDTANLVIAGTPAKSDTGSYVVSFMVADSVGGMDTISFGVTVRALPSTSVETVSFIETSSSVYPNPFNPSTTVSYSVSTKSNVMVAVYNLNGQVVKVLVNSVMSKGSYKASLNGSNLSSGVYMLKTVIGSYSKTTKLVLAK